jgi:hypothetical protein
MQGAVLFFRWVTSPGRRPDSGAGAAPRGLTGPSGRLEGRWVIIDREFRPAE